MTAKKARRWYRDPAQMLNLRPLGKSIKRDIEVLNVLRPFEGTPDWKVLRDLYDTWRKYKPSKNDREKLEREAKEEGLPANEFLHRGGLKAIRAHVADDPRLKAIMDAATDGGAAKTSDAGTGDKPARAGGVKPQRTERVWSRPHCPSCGAPDIKWITQKDFAERAGIKPNTVSDRVNDGKYWTRADKCVPWCDACKAGTAEGPGDVAPDTAYKPSPGDIEQITGWAYEALKPFGLQKHLPGLNHLKGFEPKPGKYGQQLALECLEEAISTIYLLANDRKGLPTRDEAVKAATDAIQEKRGDDIENVKQTGHDMDKFSRPHGSGGGRRAVAEPEDVEKPPQDTRDPAED